MAHRVSCLQCGFAVSADAVPQARCSRCGAALPTVAVPPARQVETSVEPHQQWFVTLPDGRNVGPLTAQQIFDATQRGSIAPEALVRRGDWSDAITNAQFLAQQGAGQSSERPAGPSYSRQFVRNPIGTYFFGPKLSDYQAGQGPDLLARRKRHFRVWLYVLVVMFLSAILLPLFAGLVRGNAKLAAGGVLFGLFAFFWPTIFFLIGMLMYAGAWFEWEWFFRSRTVRHARGMFGDSGARSFYLIFGGVLMAGGALFSLGGSVLIAGSFLLNPGRPGVAGGGVPAPQQRVTVAEKMVLETRQLFEQNARPMREHVDRINAIKAEILRHPHDLKLRDQQRKAEDSLSKEYADYRLFRDQWQESVKRLEQRVAEANSSSRILQANREVPPELDFSEQVVPPEADRFPLVEVRMATGRLLACQRGLQQMLSMPDKLPRTTVERLVRDFEQQRDYLLTIEQTFGYRSPGLDGLTSSDDLAKLVAQSHMEQSIPGRDPRVRRHANGEIPDVAIAEQNPKQKAGSAERPNLPPDGNRPPRNVVKGATPATTPMPHPTSKELPLLARFAPERQTLRGSIKMENDKSGPALITDALSEHALFYLDGPALTPRYEFAANLTRLDGEGGFFFVFTLLGRQAALVIDGGDESDHTTGLVAVDNQVLSSPRYPDKLLQGTQFPQGKKVHVACKVEGNRLTLRVDEAEVYQWEGKVERLSLPPFYRSEHLTKLHAGSFHSRFRLEDITVQTR